MSSFEEFKVLHEAQLKANNVPEHLWESLSNKLENQIFDAGEVFGMLVIDYCEDERSEKDPLWAVVVNKEGSVKKDDPTEIYLIDHAFTFKSENLRQHLLESPGLLKRLSVMMGIADDQSQVQVKQVMNQIWRHCSTYNVVSSQDNPEERSTPIWYVMDELGTGIQHNDDPNFRLVPFIHLPQGITYSLLFPIKDVEEGDQVTRDFVEGVEQDSLKRNALLLSWRDYDFSDESFELKEPDASYFASGRTQETLPGDSVLPPMVDCNRSLKVYSDYEYINQYLTDPCFEIVKDKNADSDVFWYTAHFKGYKELGEQFVNKFINQFPSENVLTVKDLLSIVARRAAKQETNPDTLETFPVWYPTTFNLRTELIEFVSYYQNREKKGLDNHWIVKPWNLARTMDTSITSNLHEILRLSQTTNPKICQKYIENPVLFDRPEIGKVKFDVRYVILLKSVDELDVYIYKNFFLRFANEPFILDKFDSYETHFTVMNYRENSNLKHLKCSEFRDQWKEQYPSNAWSTVEDKICKMLKELFVAATELKPPCGIGWSPQSRALYATDIMLSFEENGEIQPKLLELNFMPDCKRACEYYPDFYNDIFKLLFLDIDNPDVFRKVA